MAVLCRSWALMDECARALNRRRLPHKVRKGTHDFDPLADTIKVMTSHASKGLEFPVVAVMGARQAVAGGQAGAKAEEGDPLEEMRTRQILQTPATEAGAWRRAGWHGAGS